MKPVRQWIKEHPKELRIIGATPRDSDPKTKMLRRIYASQGERRANQRLDELVQAALRDTDSQA